MESRDRVNRVIFILSMVLLVLPSRTDASIVPLRSDGHEEQYKREVIALTSDPKTVEASACPPPLAKGQTEWRDKGEKLGIQLNSTNIDCNSGVNCPETNKTQEWNIPTFGAAVEIQQGDRIGVHLDIEAITGNSTGQVTVTELPVGGSNSCDVLVHPILLTTESQNLTLGDDILRPGDHVLFVRHSSRELECDIIWRLKVMVRDHECSKGKETTLCSGKGICAEDADTRSFSCHCCPGYVGKYCEERDGCYGNPCKHGGFCVDIAEGLVGTTYQCLCPHGYRGRSCEGEVNLCDRRPCFNNGSCHGNQTDYRCLCPKGFSGPDCETNINECLSNPCIHGMCEDGLGGYKCYCLPGYGGDHCEFEYDECDSSPCINGGACEDLVAGYRCHCGPGYRGRRCQIKVDLCQPNPCPPPAQCVDRGNNYSCVCHPGYNGPGCTQHYDPCYPNPCQNGGSCFPSLDSYFCSCRPGYTGDLCEETLHAPQPLPRTLDDPGEPEEGATTGPTSVSLDHLHNMYIAAATLAGACLIVVAVVTICHCRIHKTYLRFTRKLSRSCSEIKQQKLPRQVFIESSWERF